MLFFFFDFEEEWSEAVDVSGVPCRLDANECEFFCGGSGLLSALSVVHNFRNGRWQSTPPKCVLNWHLFNTQYTIKNARNAHVRTSLVR